MPFEMRADIFLNLDRFSLDRAGFACPQFHATVSCLVNGSLRVLDRVCLEVSNPENSVRGFLPRLINQDIFRGSPFWETSIVL